MKSTLKTVEFRLLAACSFLDRNDWTRQRDQVIRLLDEGPDPVRFVALVKRHRLQVLAHQVLDRASREDNRSLPWVRSLLYPLACRTRLHNLVLEGEWQRLRSVFSEAGVPVMTLKGTALSERLYGDPGLRHTRDIDLMVPPEQVERATSVLKQAGYSVDEIAPPRAAAGWPRRLFQMLQWHIGACLPSRQIRAELHWRFERMPMSDLEQEWLRCMTNSREDRGSSLHFDLLYCCLHGSSHGWARLKWLGDVRVLVARLDPADWSAVLSMAGELRMEATLAHTFLLISSIYEFPLPTPAVGLVRQHRVLARQLADSALDWLAAPEKKLDERRWVARIRAEQRLWQHHYRYRAQERLLYWVGLALFSAGDMRSLQLPAWLIPLYPVIRPFSLIRRAVLAGANRAA